MMMSKLTAQGSNQNNQFKPKIYQGKRRGQSRNYCNQVNYQNRYRLNSGDRQASFRGRGQYGQNYRGRPQYANIYRMTLGETILEKCKTIEVKILEVDIDVIIEITTLEEVEVGLGKDNIQVILEGITVAVGLDQAQEPVPTETELDVLSVGNMIILLKTSNSQTEIVRTNTTNV